MPRPKVTAESFWNRVDRRGSDECWNWTGNVSIGKRNKEPYGRIDAFGFKGVYVHRVAYWLANGGELSLRKDGDVVIRHACDNTLCCNPRHLVIGTHADNVRDMMARGRQTKYLSVESPRAKLTASDVRAIREHRKNGVPRKELAFRYKVSEITIKGVTSGRH